jgi:2,2-dialkylglycine decarboxylase (pyruvate)
MISKGRGMPLMPSSNNEQALLAQAREYSFRGRMDKGTFTGPIFERASGAVVIDTNGKNYLDFNSGQMCSALGHNHPRIVAAIE